MGLTDNRDNTDNLTPPRTNTLEDIFRTSDKVIGVGKFTGVPGDGFFTPIAPPPILAQKQQVADISTIVDGDGVVRRGTLYPISDGSPESKIPSLALKLTTKPMGEGSGLGLYIVYELVQKHQGAIGVKSQVGEYTEFEVVFPKSQLVFEGERE